MESNYIYEPLKTYKNVLKDKHNENVNNYFKELTKKSNVDVSLNKETIKKLRRYEKDKKNINKAINKYMFLRIILILLSVVLVLVGYNQIANPTFFENRKNILIIVVEVIVIVLSILLTFLKINPHMKMLKNNVNELSDKINKLTKEASKQMQPLNDLFEEGIQLKLFKKTLPLLNFDKYFDSKRLDYLVEKFGLTKAVNLERSTLYVKSGDIEGNPFYIANDLVHQMGVKTYTGTKTISWTSYTTVNGKRVAQRRTQVLTATVTKPYPYYNQQSYLVYGNEAAPDLIFDRTDSDAEIMNQKQIDRHVKRTTRKLRRKQRKDTRKGGSYTTLANSEFEVLFGATNRNNEVQFRLLFTPLAQKQLLDLMKDKEIGYGDNFDFTKHEKINIVYPEHLNMIDLDKDSNYFKSIDYEEIKMRFINYNNEYFKAIYFAFAPILSIPLYQQQKPHEYIYKDLYDSYVSFYEHEKIVNQMGEKHFAHPESKTRSILKTSIIKSKDNKDQIKVNAYSYKIKKRTDFVTRLGGDGRVHSIPVFWDEFIPIMRESKVDINIIEDDKELTYNEKARKFIENLKKKDSLSEKELHKIGRFITYIYKD